MAKVLVLAALCVAFMVMLCGCTPYGASASQAKPQARYGIVERAETSGMNKFSQNECIKWAASAGKDAKDVSDKNWLCLRMTQQAL